MGIKLLLVVACALTLVDVAPAAGLKACIPDYQSSPFSSPDGGTPGQRVVAMAVRRQGDNIQFLAAPWARCVAGMTNGQYDLIIGVEADEDLLPAIAFPEKSGKPDTSRRLGTVEYVLVRKTITQPFAGDRASKDVSRFVIVPTSGYAAARSLSMSGARTKAMNYDAGRFVTLLCHDRVDMVVLRRSDLGPALPGCMPTGTILIQSYFLVTAEVYVGIRRSLLQSRPELAESIWREVERIRTSPDWPNELVSADHGR